MKMGRPKLPLGKSKDSQVNVRLTSKDLRLVRTLSRSLGINNSEVMRQALGYMSFLSNLKTLVKRSEVLRECRSEPEKQSIRNMAKDGYRVLVAKELEQELNRMESTGFMSRDKLPNTPEGKEQAKRLHGTYCNAFKKV